MMIDILDRYFSRPRWIVMHGAKTRVSTPEAYHSVW